MVEIKGLKRFAEHFKDWQEHYVLIGGVASSMSMDEAGLSFRATKDLDIVLVVEVLSAGFVSHFWDFIKEGNYEIRERGDQKPNCYRFSKPANPEYPAQLELFSRIPEGLTLDNEATLTPIPVEDNVSSLSAILLDENYYGFLMAGIENQISDCNGHTMTNTLLRYSRFGEPESTLELVSKPLSPLRAGQVRVQMLLSPVNASDLIPITGAYGHRITPPLIAGYEGVGIVTEAPADYAHLFGKRVLPLRGQGTWQRYVDCPAELAIPVPDDISNEKAARAWINPLAAILMLKHFSAAGKRVLVTAAGSECAQLLGQWALRAGAREVLGIYRSPVQESRLRRLGIIPIHERQTDAIIQHAQHTEVVYEAVGGVLASTLLSHLPESAHFVSYGLLSSQPFSMQNRAASLHWFHMRNDLSVMDAPVWQAEFKTLWTLLRHTTLSDTTLFAFPRWQEAIAHYKTAARVSKTMLDFTAH
jgi:NADPH:quinone reductase-like Zn-dependent oxidoreductase